ncbi:MAG: hypothetical protein ACOC1K_02300 [Nanoarchaeota archaeon]
MPNNYDFSKLKEVERVLVNPEGWDSPLYVEYGLGEYASKPSYFWRVQSTQHTFVIPVIRMDFLSSGNYVKHFKEALESFREDYKSWEEKGINTSWVNEYRQQYSNLIQ